MNGTGNETRADSVCVAERSVRIARTTHVYAKRILTNIYICMYTHVSLSPLTAALDGDDAQSIDTMSSEVLLRPFKLAVATGNAKLQEASLACLHKILAHGIFAEDTGAEV